MKLVVPFALIGLGLAGLITMGVIQSGVPELQVAGLVGPTPSSAATAGRELKVHGIIESIQSQGRPLRFMVRDKGDEKIKVEVVSDRTRPDTFQETYDVAVQGHFDPATKVFTADQIFTKCPSKYEGMQKAGLNNSTSRPADPAR